MSSEEVMGFLETTPILVVSGTLFLEMYNHLNPITRSLRIEFFRGIVQARVQQATLGHKYQHF